MRYMIPKQFWQDSSFDIFDENRRPKMSVREPDFSWDHCWTVEDLQQKTLGYLDKDDVTSSVETTVFRDEKPWITLNSSAFDTRISRLELGGPCTYWIQGRFWQRDYAVYSSDERLAAIGQHRWAHADMISVETVDKDDVPVLLLIISVEQILHE